MTEVLPYSKLADEINELRSKLLASVNVSVTDFRSEVVGIKNRIGARLVGLQLGAFAPAIKTAYEDAVTRLFEKFVMKLNQDIEQSVTAKLLDLSQSVSLAGHEVEETTKQQIIELDKKRFKEREDLEAEYSKLKSTHQAKIDELTSIHEKKLNELKTQHEDELSKVKLQRDGMQRTFDQMKQEKNQEITNLRSEISSYTEQVANLMEQINTLQEEETSFKQEINTLQTTVEEQKTVLDRLTSLTGPEGKANKIDMAKLLQNHEKTTNQLQETLIETNNLREEVNRFNSLTEKEPKYRIFWMLRRLHPSWVTVKRIAEAIGVPSAQIRKHLDEYAKLGIVLAEDDRVQYNMPKKPVFTREPTIPIIQKEKEKPDVSVKLKEEISQLKEQVKEQKVVINRLSKDVKTPEKTIDVGALLGDVEKKTTQLTEQTQQVKKLQEEVNRIYNLTERDPKYRVYWMLRDMKPSWVAIKQIASSIGIPSTQVLKHLKEYESIGLIALEGTKAKYVELVKKASIQE